MSYEREGNWNWLIGKMQQCKPMTANSNICNSAWNRQLIMSTCLRHSANSNRSNSPVWLSSESAKLNNKNKPYWPRSNSLRVSSPLRNILCT